MSRVYWACWLLAVFLSVGLLFKFVIGMSPDSNDSNELLNDALFVRFEYDNVQIFVPRIDVDPAPTYSGEIIEGRLFVVVRPDSGLQFEEVDSGCGCAVVRPVPVEPRTPSNHPIEMAFSVNTLGKVGPQEFMLTFKFRGADGTPYQYQARLFFILEQGLEVPRILKPIGGDDEVDHFTRTIQLRSKLPDIAWDSINVIVTGGEAEVSLKQLGKIDGFSMAELSLTGRVADVSQSGLSVVFESKQFKDQPMTRIPLIKTGQLVWKPERLEFREQYTPRLIVQANIECTVDDFGLDIDSDQFNYQIKQIGKLFVIEFQFVDQASIVDRENFSGFIRLLKQGVVVAEIPYQWSEK